MVGTPDTLAPELMGISAALDAEGDYGASVDWWGLGILTCEIHCGLETSALRASGASEAGGSTISEAQRANLERARAPRLCKYGMRCRFLNAGLWSEHFAFHAALASGWETFFNRESEQEEAVQPGLDRVLACCPYKGHSETDARSSSAFVYQCLQGFEALHYVPVRFAAISSLTSSEGGALAGGPRTTRTSPQSMILGIFSICIRRTISSLQDRRTVC